MVTLWNMLGLAVFAISGLAIWTLYPYLSRFINSPLNNLPGPPNPSWIYGNLKVIEEEDNSVPQERWMKEHKSHTIMYRGLFSMDRLWTLDTRALNHILTHSVDYPKPTAVRRSFAKLFGGGLFFTEGEEHRAQRRVMNPAFGPSQIRDLTEIFVDKATELRDLWDSEIGNSDGLARIDALKGLSKTTLDIMGLAGFNYRFNAFKADAEQDELIGAFNEILNPTRQVTFIAILRNLFPILQYIPDREARRIDHARSVMSRIGLKLIADKKAAIMRERAESKEKNGGSDLGRSDMRARDLLTLLLKANMATDIPDSQRLSDANVLAQVPTFLLAGHETTATATTWCLYALTQAPAVQEKLRAELCTLDTDTPTMEELSSLPYLDMVVRETLRLHTPVSATIRMAMRDDVIPVAEPFVDRNGEVQDSIKISKDTPITIPILALNRSRKLWGDDALEFKPERWESLPEAVSSIPGVWGHILTFLGGPRACIGYRFALVEMKALVFTLVRAFAFELAVPNEDVQKKSQAVLRPIIRSAPEAGSQMPLLVKRARRE